jgi:hypothetical protein
MAAIKTNSSVFLLVKELMHELDQITGAINRRSSEAGNGMGGALDALEMLPLATDEFGLLRNRLINAFSYLNSSEWGAARFEVTMVRGWLRTAQIRFAPVPALD